ncbi:MAG: HEAT repeat domain-containing protein [Planctomycetales bacterium]|nr:HEAT repeat domain-containing protein [Planctomycetales bacterium]
MPSTQFVNRVAVLTVALIFTAVSSIRAAESSSQSADIETQLLATLRSDAPPAEKAITCKRLAIHGSSAAVPELARLLPDEQLSSWARIALEAIPGEAADEALRNATDSIQGRLLVGMINSIGVRRDAKAVARLTAFLQDKDAEVASAAAVALGRIGNSDAVQALRQSLAAKSDDVRSAVAEGCILCAERLLGEGKSGEAAKLYDEVRKAKVPQQRNIEATRGAILARGPEGIPLLLELLRSSDKKLFQLALGTAREFPGSKVDQALADELAKAKPERAALIVEAMADRTDTVVLAAVLKAAGEGPKQARAAAIAALARVGDASCLSALLGIALESDKDLADLAKSTLAELPGKEVDAKIIALLPDASGEVYPLLLETVGQRRIDAKDTLLKALSHADKSVRGAALAALGETVDLDGLSVLVSQVVAPKFPEDASVAHQALKAASIRMPDREACAAELTAALEKTSSAPTKATLLQILGDVGGANALAAIGAAAKSSDPELQDLSSRLLGKWMTADAAPVLLGLANELQEEKYQVRAIRGYIRIVRQFNLPEQQRAEMCRKAFEASRRPAEQKMVLEVLERYPNAANLKLAGEAIQAPELREEAIQAAIAIAQKVSEKGGNEKELLSQVGLSPVELKIVKAEYGAGTTQKDVTATLRTQAKDLPVIALASTSYNASFGGDPLPGTAKILRIQYQINGKPGEASFPENALIILPMPE